MPPPSIFHLFIRIYVVKSRYVVAPCTCSTHTRRRPSPSSVPRIGLRTRLAAVWCVSLLPHLNIWEVIIEPTLAGGWQLLWCASMRVTRGRCCSTGLTWLCVEIPNCFSPLYFVQDAVETSWNNLSHLSLDWTLQIKSSTMFTVI